MRGKGSQKKLLSFRKQWVQRKAHPSGWLDSVNQRAKFLLLSVGRPHLSQWSQLPKDHLSSFSLSLCLSLCVCLCLQINSSKALASTKMAAPWTVILEQYLVWGSFHFTGKPFDWRCWTMDSTPISPLNVRVDQLGQLFSSVYFLAFSDLLRVKLTSNEW